MRLGAGRSQDGEGTAQLHGDWVGGEANAGGRRMAVDEREVLVKVSPGEFRAPFCRPRRHRLYPRALSRPRPRRMPLTWGVTSPLPP